jgi:beta-galactosidase
MAETINEGIPPWLFERYPQAAFIAQDGQAQALCSYLHPDFLACAERWYQAVFEVLTPRQVTQGGKIIMVQLDNEMGMLQWVRNLIDLNPDTLRRFAAFAAVQPGADGARRYPAEPLADFLAEQIRQPQAPYGGQVIADYRRFYRQYLRDYALHLLNCARANGLEVPPVANVHGFGNGGKTFPIGLSQLVEVMEIDGMVSATDVYPLHIGEGNFHQLVLVNEMTKALQIRDQALFSIEFQAGGNLDFGGSQSSLYDLHSRLCIACGMRAINHYLFFDGENHPALSPVKRHNWGHPVRKDGSVRRHYKRYAELSRVLRTYGDALIRAQPRTVTSVGFLLDHFMTEVNNALTRPMTDVLTHQREVVLFDFIARGLALTHRPFRAVEVSRAVLDVQTMPHLWLMMDKQCDAATQQKLVDYVRQGGRLALIGRMCEQTFDQVPCRILADAIGLDRITSDAAFSGAQMTAFGYQDVPVSFMECYHGTFDEILARSAAGDVVGFSRRIGAGEVLVLGAALRANTLEDLDILHRMANRLGCPALFSLTEWADVRLCDGEAGSFLFVNNYQDDPVELVIASAGAPFCAGHTITLPARRGAILPLEWQALPGVLIHYLTAEVVDLRQEGGRVVIQTAQPTFHASLTLTGYRCDGALEVEAAQGGQIQVHGSDGRIVLVPV